MEEIAIRVDNVSKDFRLPVEKSSSLKSHVVRLFRSGGYKKQKALQDISVEIKKGEFFGIVGRNGSGKSTLLKIIAGIYQPTRGKVSVAGKLVPFIELGVGFNPELTGRENIFLNGALLGFSRKEVDDMYDEIVEFAELEKFMDQKLKNYSSGMQVRLAFSMAVRAKADILLIDEVLAVGDADFQRKCFEYFKGLKQQHTTVVFVSHNMDAVREFCDRAILIEDNELKDIGKPEVIASKYHKVFSDSLTRKNSEQKASSISGEERWGDNKATITRVKVKESPDGKDLLISIYVTANEDIEKPIVGFSIKNVLLTQLIGNNTLRVGHKMEKMKAGQSMKIEWKLANVFNEGRYYIDATIAHDNASSVAERWPEAASLYIHRENSTPYLLNTQASVESILVTGDDIK